MKILHLLAAFSLIVAFATCQKDNESEGSDEIVIVDGVIKSPAWLIHKVDSIAHRYQPGPVTGKYPYPQMYSVVHKNQEYLYLSDGLNSCWTCGHLFFTLSGEPIEPSDDPTTGLYADLSAESNRTLLWDP